MNHLRFPVAILFVIFLTAGTHSLGQSISAMKEASEYFEVYKSKPRSKDLKNIKLKMFQGKFVYYDRDNYERLSNEDPLAIASTANNYEIDALMVLKDLDKGSKEYKEALQKLLSFKANNKYYNGYMYKDRAQQEFMRRKAVEEMERNGTMEELADLRDYIVKTGFATAKLRDMPAYNFDSGQFNFALGKGKYSKCNYAYSVESDDAEKLVLDKKFLEIKETDVNGITHHYLFTRSHAPPDAYFLHFTSNECR